MELVVCVYGMLWEHTCHHVHIVTRGPLCEPLTLCVGFGDQSRGEAFFFHLNVTEKHLSWKNPIHLF